MQEAENEGAKLVIVSEGHMQSVEEMQLNARLNGQVSGKTSY